MTQVGSKRLRVLFVEDSDSDAQLLLREFRRAGYELTHERVDTASTLDTALNKAPWDVILADFSMPKFSGTDALAQVRALGMDVPFLFVSGTIGEDTAVQAMKAGAQDYIMKSNLKRVVPAVEREIAEFRKRRERREAEEQLRKLSRALDQASESVFITDQIGRIEYVNPALERLTGYSAIELRGASPALFRSGHHSDEYFAHMWQTILAGNVFRDVVVNVRKDGSQFYEEKVITPLKDDFGNITHFVSTGRDITERIKAEEARTRLAAILEATTDLVAMLDPDGRLRYLNASGRNLLGLPPEYDISKRHWKEMFPEDEARRVFAEAIPAVRRDGAWSGETSLRGKNHRRVPVSQVILAHRDSHGAVEFLSTIVRDISERKHFEAELRHRATHDDLTGLANRLLLADRIETALRTAQRRTRPLAVIFLDIDNFKRVNDTLGHDAGDSLLKHVAGQLQNCVQPTDSLARHGGDEFAMVVSEVDGLEDVLHRLRNVQQAFMSPVKIHDHDLFVTLSLGVAMYPHDGRDAATLMRNADTAVYQAKAGGRDQYCFYAPVMNARGHDLLALEGELRRALERDQFLLHYQPQVELRSGQVHALEALIRWRHPDRGLLSPAEFMPLLEETGLIVPVGEWVLKRASEQCRAAGLRLAVNVSARQFDDPQLVDKIRSILSQAQLPPDRLELEITENILMRDVGAATQVLERLHDLGVRLAVDDFGTGYSSLAYLKRFPLHVLKIDQTFVRDVTEDSNDASIVEASISLGHKLGLELIAEGVETSEQLDYLRLQGCDAVQGYYISRPQSFADIETFLQAHADNAHW